MWKKFDASKTNGVVIPGDDHLSPTRWYNHLFLKFFRWKTIVLFEVNPEDATAGYRVGFIPCQGASRIRMRVSHAQHFRMRIGRETCVFFAIRTDGTEVHLQYLTRARINDPRFTKISLF